MLAGAFSHLRRSRSLVPGLTLVDTRRWQSNLAPFLFTGSIHYADTPDLVEHWCDSILKHRSLIGLDSEWKPERKRGENNPIALLQMSFRNEGKPEVLLVHTPFTGIPAKLQELLMDENLVKVGADMKQDKRKLKLHFGVELKGALDLARSQNKILRGNIGSSKTLGIRFLIAKLLGQNLKKDSRWQRSNWDKRPLQRQQMEYAALDAFGPLAVYEKLKELESRPPPLPEEPEISPLGDGLLQPQ